MSNFNFSAVANHYCSVNQNAIAAMPLEEQVAFFEGILTLEGMGAESGEYIPDNDLRFYDKMEETQGTIEDLKADGKAFDKACEDYYKFLASMNFDRFLSVCKNGDRDIDTKAIERSFQSEKTLEAWRV